MKRSLLLLLLLFPYKVLAKEIEVEFSKCIDGDTARFIMDGENVSVRFLAIDTPETVHPSVETETYGKNASEYTCNRIKNAQNITLEFDKNSDEQDKYDRYLAWIFVDDSLLQKELVAIGYAEVAYLYGDYKYTDVLEYAQDKAQEKQLGIWQDLKEKQDFSLPITIGTFLLLLLITYINKKLKRKYKKFLRKMKDI